jgi:hypothetical protein
MLHFNSDILCGTEVYLLGRDGSGASLSFDGGRHGVNVEGECTKKKGVGEWSVWLLSSATYGTQCRCLLIFFFFFL